MWNLGHRGPGGKPEGQLRGLSSGPGERRQWLGPGRWQRGCKGLGDPKGLAATVDVGWAVGRVWE